MLRLMTLTNFQAFHSEVHFPLEKLTLIFGPNGAGKTSIFRALQLLGMNSDSLLSGQMKFVDNTCDFKNFKNLVYMHDQSNVMKIGIFFDADELFEGQHSGKRFSILADTIDASDPMVEVEPPLDQLNVRFFSVTIEISGEGSISKISIGALESLPSASNSQDSDGLVLSLTKFEDHWLLDASSEAINFAIRYGELLEFLNDPRSSFEDTPWYSQHVNLDKFAPIEEWLISAFVRNINLQKVEFYSRLKELTFTSKAGNDNSSARFLGLVTSHLSFVLNQFELEMSRFLSLPPLRDLPKPIEYGITDGSRPFVLIDYPPIDRSQKSELISKLLYEFSGRYRFIERQAISAGGADVIERLLFDEFTNSMVRFEDVGVGVSQVLPILIAIYDKVHKVLAIEQPEIHLHPKLQSKLMDLFIEVVNGFGWSQSRGSENDMLHGDDPLYQPIAEPVMPIRTSDFVPRIEWHSDLNLPRTYPAAQVILETHSENLILRLQRRITEGLISLERVSVIYVDSADIPQVRVLKPSEGSDFLSSWPKSFVDLRIEEIFGSDSFTESDDI
jgi:energy-coupling factor transporter ATP-binding protein EcfA2